MDVLREVLLAGAVLAFVLEWLELSPPRKWWALGVAFFVAAVYLVPALGIH